MYFYHVIFEKQSSESTYPWLITQRGTLHGFLSFSFNIYMKKITLMPNKMEREEPVLDEADWEELSTLVRFSPTYTVWVTWRQTPLLRGGQPSLIRWSDSADSEHKGVCLCFYVCVCWPVILCDSTMNERVCVHVGICECVWLWLWERASVCACVCCHTSWSGISEERVFPSTAAVR